MNIPGMQSLAAKIHMKYEDHPEVRILATAFINLADNPRDEYHSMKELYEHRLALTVALFNTLSDLWQSFTAGAELDIVKSKLHHDGTMFPGGYFIVVMNSEHGQISYHYELKYWDMFKIPAVERVPWPYDGHTPDDTIKRLLAL